MTDTATKASQLLALHHAGTPVVLPTVWDAWSARAVVDAGFAALTIGSHPLADSRGQKDNEGMTLDDALDGIRHITGAVDVPVSADVESGYDTAPAASHACIRAMASASGSSKVSAFPRNASVRALITSSTPAWSAAARRAPM